MGLLTGTESWPVSDTKLRRKAAFRFFFAWVQNERRKRNGSFCLDAPGRTDNVA